MKRIDYLNDFVAILAEDMVTFGKNTLKSFGVSDLISKTLIKCK